MESPLMHLSQHMLDESNTASTASSPPDPHTPPQELYSYRDYPEDLEERKGYARVHSPATYIHHHHQQHHQQQPQRQHSQHEQVILPPLPAYASMDNPPNKFADVLPQQHHPVATSSPTSDYSPPYHAQTAYPASTNAYHHSGGFNDRIPPLERASVDGNFWPSQSSASLSNALGPPSAVRRTSIFDDIYSPHVTGLVNPNGHGSPLEPSPPPQASRETLPRIHSSYGSNAEWPPQPSSQSTSPSPVEQYSYSSNNQVQLPPISYSHQQSTSALTSILQSQPSYYTPQPSSYEQPPFYRRASYPISRDDCIPFVPPLSSSVSSTSSYFDQNSVSSSPSYTQPSSSAGIKQGPPYSEPLSLSGPPPLVSSVQHANPQYGNGGGYSSHMSRTDSEPLPHLAYPPQEQQQSQYQQQQQQPTYLPRPSDPLSSGGSSTSSLWSYGGGQVVTYTDDANSKETAHLRRRCFNCQTTEPPSWRRSTLNPGKIVCNRCGLYERTHLRPRPSGIGGELRRAPPSSTASVTRPVTQSMLGHHHHHPYSLSPTVSKAARAKNVKTEMQIQEYGTVH